ncbi:MAG: hypothetical protein KF784_13675 [Fimbriimonadaceae bacterium]|nr:hypothetical protein [Fimbriimonadaceae bacterium]
MSAQLGLRRERPNNLVLKSALLLFVAIVALVAGCGEAPEPSIVGTWEAEFKSGNNPATITQNFSEDGIFTFQTRIKNPGGGKDITITARGTYSIQGKDRLLTTPTDYGYAGIAKEAEPGIRLEIEKDKGKTAMDKIEWIDENTISIKSAEETTRFKRIKPQ